MSKKHSPEPPAGDPPGGKDESPDEYRVGYGKPQKEHQYKKGETGNRKGRPKAPKPNAASLLAIIEEPLEVRRDGKVVRMQGFEISLRHLLQKAVRDGDVGAGIEFVRICEKYGVIEQVPVPRRGGVIIMGSEEDKRWQAQKKK